MKRFEFAGGGSHKFWEIEAKAKEIRVRFGKLGSNGQLKLQTFGSRAQATAAMIEQIAEKTKKGYVEAGAVAAVPKTPVKTSGIVPTELAITHVAPSTVHRVAIYDDGQSHVALAVGGRCMASSDGKKFHGRPANPGDAWGLSVYDGVAYAMAFGSLRASSDAGATWRALARPTASYIYTMMRDSTGTYWLGADHGEVLTSQRPDKGWKPATFKMPGKVMAFAEIDGALFVVGAGCGIWNGKKLTPLKGPKKTEVITRIIECPSGALVLIGDAGRAYRSKDRGRSFTKVRTGVVDEGDLEDCAWVAGSLFAVGGGWNGAAVVRSDDEGRSWNTVPIKSPNKFWGIASWGDGAILGGESGIFTLASPRDPYWKGLVDRFAPEPAKIDAQFTPSAGRSDAQRDATHTKLASKARADHARLSAKNRAATQPDANPTLARAVDEGTEGAEAVYADWLTDAGDPRGELAQLQLRLAKDPKNKALKKAERALLAQHREVWLGKLAGVTDLCEVVWEAGFIAKARIAYTEARYAEDEAIGERNHEETTTEDVLRWLLASPSARFLRELTIGIVTFEENNYAGVAKIIGTHYLPALRSLYLGDFDRSDSELNWSDLGNLQPMWAALPNLATLRLKSGAMKLGTIILPALERLEIVTGGGDPKMVKAIAAASWPSLETLAMQIGPGNNHQSTAKVSDLQPILDGDGLPRLTHLGITNFSLTHKLVEPLAAAKILPQLRELDLSMGTLGDESIARMFSLQRAFAHLELKVDDNYIGSEGKALLKRARFAFDFGHQREDEGGPEHRYASAVE